MGAQCAHHARRLDVVGTGGDMSSHDARMASAEVVNVHGGGSVAAIIAR